MALPKPRLVNRPYGNVQTPPEPTNVSSLFTAQASDISSLETDMATVEEQITSLLATATEFADDAAAATGTIPLGGVYKTAGLLKVRAV